MGEPPGFKQSSQLFQFKGSTRPSANQPRWLRTQSPALEKRSKHEASGIGANHADRSSSRPGFHTMGLESARMGLEGPQWPQVTLLREGPRLGRLRQARQLEALVARHSILNSVKPLARNAEASSTRLAGGQLATVTVALWLDTSTGWVAIQSIASTRD